MFIWLCTVQSQSCSWFNRFLLLWRSCGPNHVVYIGSHLQAPILHFHRLWIYVNYVYFFLCISLFNILCQMYINMKAVLFKGLYFHYRPQHTIQSYLKWLVSGTEFRYWHARHGHWHFGLVSHVHEPASLSLQPFEVLQFCFLSYEIHYTIV
jgi:hypothetical protein